MKINIGDNWKDITASKINIETNLLSYSEWTAGSSDLGVSINSEDWGLFYFGSSIASVVDGIGPFGYTNNILRNYGNASDSRVTLYSGYLSVDGDPVSIDVDQSYRFSMWLKFNNDGATYSASRLYWAGRPTGNVYPISGGASVSTGYFIETSDCTTYTGTDEWRLYIAYVRPNEWTGTMSEGGVYDTTGSLQATPVDYKFGEETIDLRLRLLCPYNSDSSFDMLYPRVDLVDGTEPSLQTLLTNEGAWRGITASKINIGDTWKTIGAAEEFSLSGGTKTTDGCDDIHTFTSDGTLTVTGNGTVTLLVVGHGVNGELAACPSCYSGAGGNGGEIIYSASYAITEGTYPVTITGTVDFDGNTATTGGGAAGGARRTSSINGADGAEGSAYTISGASVVYGSGGGSGAWTNSGTVYTGGSGGTGAGDGGDASSTPALRNGTNASNYGAGGGGGAYYGPAAGFGSGGSKVNGVVILRYTPA